MTSDMATEQVSRTGKLELYPFVAFQTKPADPTNMELLCK